MLSACTGPAAQDRGRELREMLVADVGQGLLAT